MLQDLQSSEANIYKTKHNGKM